MTPDERFMQEAISLARQGLGRTAPNPPVGAVVVRDATIVGSGYHPKAGQPHAEIHALQASGLKAKGSTLYVTLEPCNHYGRTPPCTDAIIASGISRVVVGTPDPNPVVAGKGIERLRGEGIEVLVGVEEARARELIRFYETWIRCNRPHVILKAAMSLDARIATDRGDSRWISSEESRAYVHEIRNEVDGILVGIGTVIADDPQLTCRIPGGRNPVRVIVDPKLRIPPDARCLGEDTLLITAKPPEGPGNITVGGPRVKVIPADHRGRIPWKDIFSTLGAMGMHAVLVEGGSATFSSLIQSSLVDEVMLFIAPKLFGGGIPLVNWGSPESVADALPLVITGLKSLGKDVLITARMGE
ncbi:MAG TPA: bifunctional diaminohydroxyphosphoribosylaminopyrimidine deaminase/5-amino-6-(5-phosphoribosylamino)uracil reductase RibD [Deltaproteobacteria bacterium]|nr:bifunctional diaminohydroxyphosphoribosylaminopyrimidine deaminase/5-amino-6-(5-phosphoribosylamino)uracil reductase RibD [Deltaproteobacteria bacterium]